MVISMCPVPAEAMVAVPENYTREEFETALVAIMNLVHFRTHQGRKAIMLMLTPRVRNCVVECLESWEEATRPSIGA